VSVEPAGAACLFESVLAGRLVSVPGPHDSIMAGLNCGRPSLVAWPTLSRSVDLLVSVDDEPIREAMHLAAGSGIVSGELGAAGLGGLLELLRADEGEEARRTLGVSRETRILAFNSEGATNPDAYRRIVSGRQTDPKLEA
jgi:diaminopropionate ammonia-lyase